jgi:uncharacterized protein
MQLRWLGPELTRRVKKHPEIPLSFADGYPYLLINEASFNDLQQRCPGSISLSSSAPIWWSPARMPGPRWLAGDPRR